VRVLAMISLGGMRCDGLKKVIRTIVAWGNEETKVSESQRITDGRAQKERGFRGGQTEEGGMAHPIGEHRVKIEDTGMGEEAGEWDGRLCCPLCLLGARSRIYSLGCAFYLSANKGTTGRPVSGWQQSLWSRGEQENRIAEIC